jgi:hypothetical protein
MIDPRSPFICPLLFEYLLNTFLIIQFSLQLPDIPFRFIYLRKILKIH